MPEEHQKEQQKELLDESIDTKMESIEGKTPIELLAMGVKSFWATEYKQAVYYLSKSSELLVTEHKDDKHDSLAEVYLFYGKALLELAREEGDPLGDAVPKEVGLENDEEEDEDEEEDGEKEKGDESMEKSDKKVKEGKESKKSKDSKENKDSKETKDNKETKDSNKETKENKVEINKDKSEGETKTDEDNKMETTSDGKKDKTEIKINGEDASSSKSADETMEEDEEEGGEDEEEEDDEEDAGEGTSADKTCEEEEEEPSDLQLAWEVLELAKLILERRRNNTTSKTSLSATKTSSSPSTKTSSSSTTKTSSSSTTTTTGANASTNASGNDGNNGGNDGDHNNSLTIDYADCLITLGEVSLESENFDSALADIKAGYAIQQQVFGGTEGRERHLAETCYKLGLAHGLSNRVEEGVKYYEQCLELLAKRIKTLESIKNSGAGDKAKETKDGNKDGKKDGNMDGKKDGNMDGNKDGEMEESSSSCKKELGEINALIPEIQEKISDLKTYREETLKTSEATKEPPIAISPEKKANDISHLVKRKRKLEPSTSTSEPANKKPSP